MKVSPEEFFMYLTIGLIVLVPIAARVYRYLTMRQVKQMLHEEFGRQEEGDNTTNVENRS